MEKRRRREKFKGKVIQWEMTMEKWTKLPEKGVLRRQTLLCMLSQKRVIKMKMLRNQEKYNV